MWKELDRRAVRALGCAPGRCGPVHIAQGGQLEEIFRRLLASLPDEFDAVETRTNGKEQIAFPGGGVIAFRTRNARVGRGFSFDRVIVDEAQIVGLEMIDAVPHCERGPTRRSSTSLRSERAAERALPGPARAA